MAESATGYVRLSDEADAANLSLGGMITDVERLAEKLGVRLIAMHVDNGKSGSIRDRIEFLAWLDDVREGRASVMLTWHCDRLTREGVNAAAMILDTVEGKDPTSGAVTRTPARLVDCAGLDSNDKEGFRFRFVIGAEVARGELERIKARSRAMHDRLKDAGRWNGGQPPFGLRAGPNPDGPGKVLVPDPDEAATLERIADALILGSAPGTIARRLNEDGVRSRTGTDWSRNAVADAMRGEGAEAVLGAAKRAAARTALDSRSTGPRSPGRPPRLLTGRVLCAGCRRGLRVASTRGMAVYRCPSVGAGQACAGPVVISAVSLEEYVSGRFLAGYGRMPLTERYTITTGGDAEVVAAEAAKKAAMDEIERSPTLEALERLQAAKAALDAAVGRPVVVEERERELRNAAGKALRIAEAWPERGDDWRRDLLDRWPVEIVVHPGNRRGGRHFDEARVEIEWRGDVEDHDT